MASDMLVLGIVMLGMASIAGYGYASTRGRIQDVEGRNLVTTGSLVDSIVAIEGTVAAAATDTIPAPLTGEDAVLVEWEVEADPGDDDRGMTRTGMHAVDFYLEDDRGRVRVRPKNADAVTLSSAQRTTEFQYENRAIDETFVSGLEAFDEDVRDDDPAFHHQNSEKLAHGARPLTEDRRYVQEVLRPGDAVYVYGRASRGDDGEWLIENPEDGRFLISDMDRTALVEHYSGNQTLLLIVTLLLLGVAGYTFAAMAGVF